MRVAIVLAVVMLCSTGALFDVRADDPPSAVGSMLNLLKSGRVPEERLGTIVKLICSRGNSHDLRYIFTQVAEEGHWSQELRSEAMDWLIEAAENRKVIPAGDLSGLAKLITSEEPSMQSAAVRLAGLWKVGELAPRLAELVGDDGQPRAARVEAVHSLAAIDPDQAGVLLKSLAKGEQPFAVRSLAAAGLAGLNVEQAAQISAEILADAGERDDPAPIMEAFLDLQNGSKALAEAIAESSISQDVAKLALRYMYSIGRSDPELSRALSKIAGVADDPEPPTKEDVAALVRDVAEQGDPQRGEAVFRRNDLSCMKCHAVNKAGGDVGPDLSAVGATSPVEHLVNSVLNPDQAIKEAFETKVVLTEQGRIYQGIVADRTADALVLKDANGKLTAIPVSDIDEEIEGKSLMPKGLVKFMTHAELIDLVKFLSMLGKPGEYAVRSTQRMQRWRLLTGIDESLVNEVPNRLLFEDAVMGGTNWEPTYSRVNGALPLAELADRTGQEVVYVYGEVQVSRAGPVELRFDSTEGLDLWIGTGEIPLPGSKPSSASDSPGLVIDLDPGVHRVTVRIDLAVRPSSVLKLELFRPSGAGTAFNVVDGS